MLYDEGSKALGLFVQRSQGCPSTVALKARLDRDSNLV